MTRLLRLVLLSALCALPCLAQEADVGLPPPSGLRRVTRTHGPAYRIVRTEQDAQGRRSALVLVRVMRTHGPGYRWVRVPARQERGDPVAARQQEEAAARLGPQAVERIQQELREQETPVVPAEPGPARASDQATPLPAADQAAPAPATPPSNGLIDQLEPGQEKKSEQPPVRRPRRVS